jgi:hypothetical protein
VCVWRNAHWFQFLRNRICERLHSRTARNEHRQIVVWVRRTPAFDWGWVGARECCFWHVETYLDLTHNRLECSEEGRELLSFFFLLLGVRCSIFFFLVLLFAALESRVGCSAGHIVVRSVFHKEFFSTAQMQLHARVCVVTLCELIFTQHHHTQVTALCA